MYRFKYYKITGTSLTEILVSMGILMLLSGMGWGTYRQITKSADAVRCISNLRQLGMAFHLYAAEREGCLPYPNDAFGYAGTWFNALDPHLLGRAAAASNAVQNLSLVKQDPVIRKLSASWFSNAYTFKMNQRLGEDAGGLPRFYRLTEIRQWARTVLLFDGRAETEKTTLGAPAAMAKNPQGTEGFVARRHRKGAHVLFLDAHVEHRVEKQQAGGGLGWAIDETKMIWKPWTTP